MGRGRKKRTQIYIDALFKPPKVAFDLDGTLKTLKNIEEACKAVLRKYAEPKRFKNTEEMINYCRRLRKNNPGVDREYRELLRQSLATGYGIEPTALTGYIPVITSSGVGIFVVTGNDLEDAREILKRLGIFSFVEGIYGNAKTALEKASALIRIREKYTLLAYIGDTKTDRTAAEIAGVKFYDAGDVQKSPEMLVYALTQTFSKEYMDFIFSANSSITLGGYGITAFNPGSIYLSASEKKF